MLERHAMYQLSHRKHITPSHFEWESSIYTPQMFPTFHFPVNPNPITWTVDPPELATSTIRQSTESNFLSIFLLCKLI
jgi:hypothetical protein